MTGYRKEGLFVTSWSILSYNEKPFAKPNLFTNRVLCDKAPFVEQTVHLNTLPSTIMENNDTPLPERRPSGNGLTPNAITLTRLQLELQFLKDDYKQLLGELHQKNELVSIQAQDRKSVV